MFEVWLIIFLILLLLNAWATYWVFQDDLSSQGQRVAQLAIVWCLPFAGAALTILIKRQKPTRASGRYREEPNPGDDFGYSGRSHRQNKDRFEDESTTAHGDASD